MTQPVLRQSADFFSPPNWPTPAEVNEVLNDINQSSMKILVKQMKRNFNGDGLSFADDLGLGKAFSAARLRLLSDPGYLAKQQFVFWQQTGQLWQNTVLNLFGISTDPVIAPATDDYRFRDDAWEQPIYAFIKQSYLLAARCVRETYSGIDGLDSHTSGKVEFFARQFVDALAPSNFLLSNPSAQREFVETGGLSLLSGLRNLLRDLEKSKDQLKISMVDDSAFELGKNIALTPGKVVLQNDMMQLIQYQPSTDNVLKRPLLIVPPWINKYYILDLREKNSFIRWAVAQGHTVFVISWINPGADYADKGFDDYLREGPVAAVRGIEKATGEKALNAIGYCLGGTLLSAALAYMASKRINRIKSATFFASMMDFACPGELGVFIDEAQLQALEKRMERGFLDGSEMAATFNMLRANDLIWSFVVNNYLMGKEPFPFDLLYWNADSTCMPARMHSFYLRSMYHDNLLRERGGLKLDGISIKLDKVTVPTYFLSTKDDHIAPWRSTYAGTQLLSGDNRFVLAGSGHIAGVINPPDPQKLKYGYWTNDELADDPDEWFSGTVRHEGSWWPDWQSWVSGLENTQVPARKPGDGELGIIEDAPGSYVKQRIV